MEKIRENAWWLAFMAPGLLVMLEIRWLTNLNSPGGLELSVIGFLIAVAIYLVTVGVILVFVHVVNYIINYIFSNESSLSLNLGEFRHVVAIGVLSCLISIPTGVIVASAIEREFGRATLRGFANWMFSTNDENVLPRGSTGDTLQTLLRRANSRQTGVSPIDFRTVSSGVFSHLANPGDLTCHKLFGTCNLRVRIYSFRRQRGVEGFAVDWQGHGDRAQLFLSPACQLHKNDAWSAKDEPLDEEFHVRLIPGPGVWVPLSGASNEVEFVDAHESPCARLFDATVCTIVAEKCTKALAKGGPLSPTQKAYCAQHKKCVK